MKRLIKFTLTILFTLIVSIGYSQINRKQIKRNNKAMANFKGKKNGFTEQKRYYYLSVGINTMNYFGDIAPKSSIGSTKISSTRPGFTAAFGYRIGPRYTIQASLSYGTLFSDDNVAADPTGENSNYRYKRNLHFRNNIAELAVVGIFDLFQNQGSYLSRVQLTPYAILGIAGFYHNPKAIAPETSGSTGVALPEAGQWVALRPLGTEGQYADLLPTDGNFGIEPYSLWQVSIPFGLGARYRLGEALDISFDITFRYLFFDYIDDISRNYVDLDVLDSDLARAMSDRSMEATAAKSGNDRSQYISGWDTDPYTGRDEGVSYTTVNGFGQEGGEGFPNNRGGANDNDIYYVTSIKVSYILGSSFRRAKFR